MCALLVVIAVVQYASIEGWKANGGKRGGKD